MRPEVPPAATARPLGLILAGGLARRLGGIDKTLMRLDDGTRLLDVLLARLAPQCAVLALSANGDPARFAFAALPVLADAPGPSRGPLAGVLAGLDHAAACTNSESSGGSPPLPCGEGLGVRVGTAGPFTHGFPGRESETLPPCTPPQGRGERPVPSRMMAGAEAAAGMPDGWMLTVPGDTPFVPRDLVARLVAAAQTGDYAVARATCDGRLHSLVALWSCRLREPLRRALMDRDLRKVTAFQAEVGVVDVDWPAMPHDPFFNINTPDDLAAARSLHEGLNRAG